MPKPAAQPRAGAVLFDVTGSMGQVPRALQQKLPQLLGLLLRQGYVEHPQILFGAIGDATSTGRRSPASTSARPATWPPRKR